MNNMQVRGGDGGRIEQARGFARGLLPPLALDTTIDDDVRDMDTFGVQLPRHALCETWPAHQHPNFCSEPAQEDGGLARRVATPDQNDLFVSTQARLDGRSPVPDSAPLEVPEIRYVKAPVASADVLNGGDRRFV